MKLPAVPKPTVGVTAMVAKREPQADGVKVRTPVVQVEPAAPWCSRRCRPES